MRELAWDGLFNVRDLGGLPTSLSPTGQTTSGRIARGPRREWLTDKGWAMAREWGLTTVVDLRCPYETGEREGDPAVSPAAASGVTIVAAPVEDQENEEFRRICFPILDSPEAWRHTCRLFPGLVRAAFVALAEAGTGTLVHCSAGRDRTGMISALLLGNAGVAPSAVREDYASSVRAMANRNRTVPTKDRQAAWSAQQCDDWIAAVGGIVEDTAARAPEFFDLIGLEEEHRHRLRRMLTQPAGVPSSSSHRSSAQPLR